MADKLRQLGVTRVALQPLGVDTTVFHPRRRDSNLRAELGLAPATRLLIYAGRLAREKNIPVLLEAVRRLGDGYHLLLVGGGTRPRPQRNVCVYPYVSRAEDLARLFASSDALVHAGDQETFGLVVLEAMACGVPVVGVQAGGVAELVDPAVGLLARPHDAAALAQAVADLYQREPQVLGRTARARVEQRYSWDRVFQHQLALYESPLPESLLVVPDYHHRGCVDHDPAFVRAIEARLARGDEVVLHGYHHLDERVPGSQPLDWLQRRVYTAGEGEFAALAAADAHHRLQRGWDMLTGRLHWPIAGFVAPAWLLGPGARAALTQLPFRYTTTLRSIYRLPDWHETAAPSLVYSVRSAWRRALSRRWNRWLYSRSANLPLLRAGLHPADADHPNVVDDWCALLQRALEQRRPLTKRDWVEGACGAAMPHC